VISLIYRQILVFGGHGVLMSSLGYELKDATYWSSFAIVLGLTLYLAKIEEQL
jgi:hypothetical protein